MKKGYLSDYFVGVAAKVLSQVEVDFTKSNQREFNGVANLKKIFGTEKQKFDAKIFYMNDDDDEPVMDTCSVTWYDARKAHKTRTEFRLYYEKTKASDCAAVDDILFIGLRPNGTLTIIIAESNSSISRQLIWLFGVDIRNIFSIRDDFSTENYRLNFVSMMILEKLEISIEYSEEIYLEDMIQKFGCQFPSTSEFSAYARSTLKDMSPLDDPDIVLMKWIEREELLFRTFEKHIVSSKLSSGFNDDVDEFFRFALSTMNRRKSRAGHALENHVEQIFISRNIKYERNQVTENKSKPDFIFPDIKSYRDEKFEVTQLTMLGVKSTCKDRWRQVLSEADRIKEKHLLTLEASISINQTNEMKNRNLQLVIPKPIHETYSAEQQNYIMSIFDFIEMVSLNQRVLN